MEKWKGMGGIKEEQWIHLLAKKEKLNRRTVYPSGMNGTVGDKSTINKDELIGSKFHLNLNLSILLHVETNDEIVRLPFHFRCMQWYNATFDNIKCKQIDLPKVTKKAPNDIFYAQLSGTKIELINILSIFNNTDVTSSIKSSKNFPTQTVVYNLNKIDLLFLSLKKYNF